MKMRTIPIFFLAMALMPLGFCLPQAGSVMPYGDSTYFVSDAQPVPSGITGNPLDYAGKRIGLDIRNVELPRGWEGNYRFACRFPIIDYVSNRPLYMKQWAEENSARINMEHRERGIEAICFALELLRGTSDYPGVAPEENESITASIRERLAQWNFTVKYQQLLLELCEAFAIAGKLCDRAKVNLSAEDISFFQANPAYFLIPDGKTMPSLTGNVDTHFEFIAHARRVAYEDIFRAADTLAFAVRQYIYATKDLQLSDLIVEPARAKETFELNTAFGRLLIAGFGMDTLREDAAFLIDLGGDDIYRNNAGGCLSGSIGVALCIDHSGNDQYLAADGRFVQGFGFLGVGMLVDIAGDDRYVAKHFSQGAGIIGVGAVWDLAGDDSYRAHAFCQGAGMFGLGMLLDTGGEDFYDCATLGQGGATTLGMGILSDLQGDDRYHLFVGSDKDALGGLAGYGQGGAMSFRHYPWEKKLTAYGGVGMLLDDDGNDRYRSGGWCDQGGSYIMSLGVLADSRGNDHYSCHTGQGSGIHVTNAILIDSDGHDVYEGGFRAGGSGGDRSPGFLIDYHGNDVYRSVTSSYGTGCKPFCLSLFIDYEGDDAYICPQPKDRITFNNWESFGGVWPESEAYLWPYAICLDLGGEDDYQVRQRLDNTERHSFGHGIHLDTEWQGDVIGEVTNPLEPYHDFPLPDSVQVCQRYNDIKLLQSPDLFTRFQAIGRLVEAPPKVVTTLAKTLKTSTHRQFNRDLLECVRYFLTGDQLGEEEYLSLASLLQALDEEVRIAAAEDLGTFKVASAEDLLLVSAAEDKSPAVRRSALRALTKLESKKALPVAETLAEADPSDEVRRVAVRMLNKAGGDSSVVPALLRLLTGDKSPSVKVAAAQTIGELRDARAVETLRQLAQTDDAYLQRAVGKALAELCQVEGIELLINSLSFPSIDAFYNYDNNVSNAIAAYAGFDFPEEERYDQARWREWFRRNREGIDIRANVEANWEFMASEAAKRESPTMVKIETYDRLYQKYPNNQRFRMQLALRLDERSQELLEECRAGIDSAAAAAVRCSGRAVELAPLASYVATLIDAYLASSQLDKAAATCREAMRKHPADPRFIERMERCQKAQMK